MSCEYARMYGYQSACRKMFDKVNILLEAALNDAKQYNPNHPEYWRAIGRQDILLEQLELIGTWMNDQLG